MSDPKEFAALMAQAAARDDVAESHSHADGLMVRLLRSLGYDEAMDIYVDMKKWYE